MEGMIGEQLAVEDAVGKDTTLYLERHLYYNYRGRYVEISGGVNESLARAHADCARVLASVEAAWDSVDSEGSWKKPASVHLGLAQRYWVEAKRVEDSDLRLFKGLEHLIADVDASAGGYGFVWRDPEGRVVRAEARVQSKSMALGSWHCNRRELFVIAACLRRLDEEIPLFSDLKRVEIRGDSRVAVRQADPWNVPACKSMERRAILRLRGVVAEATHALKCGTPSVTVTFAHLPGVSNDIADALSRVSLTSKYIPVLEKREAVILAGCAAVEAHSWLADEAGGIHSIASVQRWRRLRACFFALKGVEDPLDNAELFGHFLKTEQDKDPFCTRTSSDGQSDGRCIIPGLSYSFEKRQGLLYRVRPNCPIDDGPRLQLVLPQALVPEVVIAIHQEGGHAGLTATLASLYTVAWSPGVRKVARKALRGCLSCALTRDRGTRAQVAFGASKIPIAPYDCIGIDIYGPLRKVNGEAESQGGAPRTRQVLSVVDRLTGHASFFLMKDARSKTLVDQLELFFWRIGKWPKEIWCDNAKNFVEAAPLVSFAMMIDCRLRTTPSYTPQCGGFWERKHREVSETLRSCLCANPEASWKWLMAIAEARVNSVFAEEWLQAREDLSNKFQAKVAKKAVDNRPLAIGDKVILYRPGNVPGMKLAPKATGPYYVLKKIGTQCYDIGVAPKGTTPTSSPQRSWMVHSSRIRRFEGEGGDGNNVEIPTVGAALKSDENNICPSCRETHSGTLVCCDGCDRWFHMSCTDYDGFQESWYCAVCMAARE
ncbi:retrovirus polyprotein, putative [Perkinsus marinus ATCC 50983]|uniref:Retrovirus polyprotein, putative n=1 Tax=Perkinsus marinus (strain ATCC 50983 / TXsc) TaxID=423536 RepID=C5LC89_PERM5|nr:retrovirus polyprotein, putative [Perkinsus marinus ATCC 50983]EER05572.1 retrovirus polyprotein, putative [Perkinsus marinus ATCC 50983]|eukprot:XP_002773756.1 retrovirus polyprotein, putative [Perkinsus marinus ATCC 50983]